MWEETKTDLRKFVADRAMWLWLAAGICIALLTLAVNALWGPGMNVAWAFVGMFIAWSIALQIWTGRRATARDNEAAVVDMSIDMVARVVIDFEETERYAERGERCYRVFVGDAEIGRITYLPAANRGLQWEAHYPVARGSSSLFASKRDACTSLVRYKFS